jgi:mannose/fructose-specific phosphotransferase system component IIA
MLILKADISVYLCSHKEFGAEVLYWLEKIVQPCVEIVEWIHFFTAHYFALN